jgi:hypothetical protein
MNVHTIAGFKHKRSASLVGIAFLLSLGSLQVRLDMMDYLVTPCITVLQITS